MAFHRHNFLQISLPQPSNVPRLDETAYSVQPIVNDETTFEYFDLRSFSLDTCTYISHRLPLTTHHSTQKPLSDSIGIIISLITGLRFDARITICIETFHFVYAWCQLRAKSKNAHFIDDCPSTPALFRKDTSRPLFAPYYSCAMYANITHHTRATQFT